MLKSTTLTMSLLALVFSASTQAAEVLSARVEGEILKVEVKYGGGCAGEHQFVLERDGCLESMPVQCSAKIVDLTTNDPCEALGYRELSFDLRDYDFIGSYYADASLEVTGAKQSSVYVTIPKSLSDDNN